MISATIVPLFFLIINFCLAERDIRFAEFHGPVLYGSLMIVTVVFDTIYDGELSSSDLAGQQSFSLLYMLIYIGVLNCSYMPNLITR